MTPPAKNTICLWFDRDAEAAARFYAGTFPYSSVGAVYRAPADNPSCKEGEVLTVEFTVMGIPCIGLNGGPGVAHNLAFSFQVTTRDQAETDRYWNAIVGNGGEDGAICGQCNRPQLGTLPLEAAYEFGCKMLCIGGRTAVAAGQHLAAAGHTGQHGLHSCCDGFAQAERRLVFQVGTVDKVLLYSLFQHGTR